MTDSFVAALLTIHNKMLQLGRKGLLSYEWDLNLRKLPFTGNCGHQDSGFPHIIHYLMFYVEAGNDTET